MDPVLELINKIHRSEEKLRSACQPNETVYSARRTKVALAFLDELRGFIAALSRISPTSLRGAAEQIRFAADRLPSSQAPCAEDLYQIANRFRAGNKSASDFARLRTLVQTIPSHPYEKSENVAANLLRLAVISISRPVVVHRTNRPVRQRMSSLPPLDALD